MRRAHALAALLALAASTLLLGASPASAQIGYPPGNCAVLVGSQNVGSVAVGQTFVLQIAPQCVFTVGGQIVVTVNGVNIPGKVANASGAVLVQITVVSATQLSVDDPTLTPAICGTNTVIARGISAVAGGQQVTQTATFTVNCTATPVATPVQGRLSLTGANSLRYAAIAAALVVAGSLTLVASRRRRSASGV